MKTVALLLIVVSTSFGAPLEKSKDLERYKKSLTFKAPCSGAPIIPIGLYAAGSAPLPQYREIDHKTEDHERSYYDSAAAIPVTNIVQHAASGYQGSGVALPAGPVHALSVPDIVSPGPAVGIFPHARVGGCNVPLLLSCAPNVVAGHLVESHGYAAPAYRDASDFTHDADWHARVASHHKVSEDFPEPQQGNHHTVSKDYPDPNLTRIVPVQPQQNEQVNHADKH